MSMISSQCDELREKAKLLRGHVDGLSAPYVIPSTKELMALTMLDSAARMESAADTIWELRCKLAGVVDQREEIERLQAENAELKKAMDFQALELGCMTDNRDVLHVENAKLRELVRLMVRRHTPISPCKNIPCGECPVKDECDQEDALIRELRIEVDG